MRALFKPARIAVDTNDLAAIAAKIDARAETMRATVTQPDTLAAAIKAVVGHLPS